MARTSIRYYLPGAMSVQYAGDAQPYWRWIALTWRGYLAVWSIWLSCARDIIRRGGIPWPNDVTKLALAVIDLIVKRAMAAAALNPASPQGTEANNG